MNKKIWILSAALLCVAVCGCSRQEEAAAPEADANQTSSVAQYVGKYEGFLPAASGPGIQTSLTLEEDGTFVWVSDYVGEQASVFTEKGPYTISGDIATLEVPGEGTRYARLESGSLRLLDQNQSPITGALADMYVLGKVN